MAKNKISQNLKTIRTALDFSQSQLSKKIKVPLKRYQAYEYGRACPTIDGLIEITEILNIPIDDFLKTELSAMQVLQNLIKKV